jgi:4-amino-4-deoxy-L-arabinose transferase-like glycosyltransferase
MTRRSWLDPTGLKLAALLALFAALANGIWIFIDDATPAWDQAHYLAVTLTYQAALEIGGPIELLRSIHGTDPTRGPLFSVSMLPLLYVFGPAARNGMLLNLFLAPILYLAAGQIAWIVFRSWIARLLTIGLVAAMPIMVGLYHNVLQDFLLVTLTTVALLALLKTEGFRHGWMSLGLGLAMGLGTLTKVTFPLFVAGPLLVVLAQMTLAQLGSQVGLRPIPGRTLARNIGAALLVYLIVIAPWYGPNLSATVDYVQSTTGGPLAEGAGPTDPLTFHAIASFTLGVVNAHVTWIVVLAGLIGVALCIDKLRALFKRPLRLVPLLSLAFLLAWVLVPYLSLATAHNQDVRLMAPGVPALAILVAGAISAIDRPRARLALIGTVGALLVYQTVNHVTSVTPSFLPDRLSAGAGSYDAVIPLSSNPIGYEQLPRPDYGTPIIEYMEGIAATQPGGTAVPRRLCLLESEEVANGNTFGYLAMARKTPFVVSDVIVEPGEEGELGERLEACDFALYVKQPAPDPETAEARLTLVNADYAASHMTPRLLRIFDGPSRTFPVGAEPPPAGVTQYLESGGRGSWVRVLVRTPAG